MLTLDEILQLRDQGLTLQIVLVFDVSKGADVLLVHARHRAAPGRPHGAAHRRRGQCPGFPDAVHGAGEGRPAGRRTSQVQRIAYEDHEAAWARGGIDALVTYEPVATRLKKTGAHASC